MGLLLSFEGSVEVWGGLEVFRRRRAEGRR